MTTFHPVNELERLLLAAAIDPAARPTFYRALPEHQLLIMPLGRQPGPEQQVMLVNEPIEIRMLEYEGDSFAPIFSSVERISEVIPEDAGYLAMNGRDLLVMLRGKNLILNPGAGCGRTFGHQEVEAILDGSMFGPQETPDVGGPETELSQPDEAPQQIIDTLTRFLAKRKEVNAAYLAQSSIPGSKQAPRLIIGLDVSGRANSVLDDASAAIQDVTSAGQIVDFVEMTTNADDEVSAYLRQQTPFHKRKKWLGLF